MRTRLVIVFLVPLIGVLLLLGGAYTWSVTRGIQQTFYTEQLGDLGYFTTSARQAMRSGDPITVEREARRYQEVYGAEVVVFDRAGAVWASSSSGWTPPSDAAQAQIFLALSGHQADAPELLSPWFPTAVVTVAPVLDDGDVIGAALIQATPDASQAAIIQQWIILAVIFVGATGLGVLLVFRLAAWVLEPVRRLDEAMVAIERGELEARVFEDAGPPELRRVALVFNQMVEEIERVLVRQQEFALNASHELRNPLNALLLRVEHLATGLDDDWADDIEETREEGRRMTRVLDTLLNLASSGKGDTMFAVVDLVKLVERRVESWRDVAAQEGVAFVVRAEPPVMVVSDRDIIESALDAVVDNAVKFSPSGASIGVSVRDTPMGCEIQVTDAGPGITAEEAAHATERFWRGNGKQNTPGSGLGLAIAADLLSTINGTLTLASPEGGGLAVSLHVRERTIE